MTSQPSLSDKALTPLGQQCLQGLMREWFQFERALGRIPIIQRLQQSQFTLEDYQKLLLNLRQQVIEGSRWITRTASSFDRTFADIRSEVIGHAQEEHRDYEILEQDYINSGGQPEDINNYPRNAGSEALHGFLMYRASQSNPVDMIGAMWMIEGLGEKMANDWAELVEACLTKAFAKSEEHMAQHCTRFMRYHGANDDHHMEKLYKMIDRVCQTDADVQNILRTARVVGRLYALQLEEVDYE
ncbi:hypothetical protein [Marinibactrum halimedae]|uniref:3-oxoacyl-ACP synthase n=1 Tax=Marinibactrum halimedae TaxID=1444977 RepID=A0AA37WMB6_9GAMM|nr:hypothetical protein [Marinibactrum halimedae]MCD9457825.1 hypothetical protein [Marinibactrum halimedae]GLS24801.1 3-oxoacyl-ACP synthase [Marinibactrum halimedae]